MTCAHDTFEDEVLCPECVAEYYEPEDHDD